MSDHTDPAPTVENDAPLTDAERRELAHTFHGVQWLSPERAECVERIIAARMARVKQAQADAFEDGVRQMCRAYQGGNEPVNGYREEA